MFCDCPITSTLIAVVSFYKAIKPSWKGNIYATKCGAGEQYASWEMAVYWAWLYRRHIIADSVKLTTKAAFHAMREGRCWFPKCYWLKWHSWGEELKMATGFHFQYSPAVRPSLATSVWIGRPSIEDTSIHEARDTLPPSQVLSCAPEKLNFTRKIKQLVISWHHFTFNLH